MIKLKDPSLFRTQCYVNGQWLDAESKKTISVDNPATGKEIGTVPQFVEVETKKAIDAAWEAWKEWRVPKGLECGLCGVNEAALAMAEVPFGGVKESGSGKEGGHEGIDDFLETRYVLMGGI